MSAILTQIFSNLTIVQTVCDQLDNLLRKSPLPCSPK